MGQSNGHGLLGEKSQWVASLIPDLPGIAVGRQLLELEDKPLSRIFITQLRFMISGVFKQRARMVI